MESKREDGRGHWPAGRRRHEDQGWGRTRLGLTQLFAESFVPGRVSIRALALVLGVSDRTVRKWLDGTNRPSPESQEAIKGWLVETRKFLKKKKGKG